MQEETPLEMLIRAVKKAREKTKERELAIADIAKDVYNKAAASYVASPALGTTRTFHPTVIVCQSSLSFSALCRSWI